MKLTKKVLSVILAVALIIGTVAVAASAETLNVYEGSVLTYDITSDKDVSQGQAEVKPGETITVTVALTTNYYPGNAGGEVIYWTKGVFDDDATVATLGTADDYWGGMTNFPLVNTAAYPSDVSPDVYTGFLRTRTGSTAHIAAGTQMAAFDKEVFYTFVFTVPEDAAIGSTVDFVMPASKICGPTQTATRTYTIRQNIGASATYAATKVADYAETVIVNALTVTVVDDVVEADKTALKTAIDTLPAYTEDQADATTWANYVAALATANEVYADTAATQDAVDAAETDLLAAIAAVKEKVQETLNVYEGSVLTYDITSDKDVSKGQAEVKPGEKITVTVALTTNYYPGNAGGEVIYWTKGVFDDDATVATLGTADDYWGGMTNFPLVNTAAYPSDVSPDVYTGFLRTRTGSTNHIAAGTQMSAFDKEVFYTFEFTVPEDAEDGATVDFVMPASKICGPTQTATRTYTIRQNIGASATYAATKVADYAETVIVNALTVTVVSDEPVTEEPTTEEPTTEELTTVIEYADLTALKQAIAAAAEADTANCTAATVAEFNAALAAAEALNVETTLKAQQEEVDAAAQRLTDAIAGLTPLAKVDYTALDAAIADYEAKLADKAYYSNWAEYEDLYNTAAEITRDEYDDEDGTKQAAVDAAAKALDEFVLVEAGADYTAVNDAITAAEAKIAEKDDDILRYTDAYIANVNAKIDAVVYGLTSKDQTTVDGYATAINEAVAAVEYRAFDYTAINDAIADWNTKDEMDYTSASWEAMEIAVADLEMGYTHENYAEAKLQETNFLAIYNELALAGPADYSDVEAAIGEFEAKIAAAVYSDVSIQAVRDVIATVDYDLNENYQETVDGYAAAIRAATEELVALTAVDYEALDAAIARYNELDKDAYKPASWTASGVDAAYATANGIVRDEYDDENGTKQAEVNAAAEALNTAIDALDEVEDKTALQAAIIRAQGYGEDTFTPDSWAAADLATVIADANVVLANADASADEIAAAIAAIETAESKLVVKADKEALLAAINEAAAKVEDDYTPDSWAAAGLANAIGAAQAVYDDDNATTDAVAAQIVALKDAVAKLVVKADKAALEEAIKAASEKAEDDYTPNSWAEADLENVIAAAQVVYEDGNATDEAIANAAADIYDAIAKLVEKADKTNLLDAINTLPAYSQDVAVEDTWATYENSLVSANEVYDDANASQAAVDAAEADLRAAIAGVQAYGACDYTALDAALAQAAELVEDDYTTSSWAAADIAAAIAQGEAVERDMLDKGDNQATINEATDWIVRAIEELELKADMTALEVAVAAEPKVAQEYATEETWKDYAAALAAAQAILDNAADTGVSVQADVDAAAADLNAANDALTEAPADYSAVEAAIAKIPADLTPYTNSTVKAVEKAVADVVYGLGVSKQDEVTAMAQAIEEAVGKLEISKAAITDLDVDLSDYIKVETRKYAFTVTGAPTKLQVISASGSTRTYDRYHRNVTVVSYNEAGEVINYVDEAPAYEIWTIPMALGEGDFQAKAKFGRTWEAFTYEFSVDVLDPADDAVTFVAKDSADAEAVAGKALELAKGGVAEITIIAPETATKAQLVFASGSTSTYTSANATVVNNGDGTCTWTILRTFKSAGTGTMDLKLKDVSGWYAAETGTITTTVVAD